MTFYAGGGFSFTVLEDFASVEMDANGEEIVIMSVDGGE